jgi:autotransporter-associated beta strand protein
MATYYWVGGSGSWNATSTTNWSLSSGGGGSAGVPTSADDVIFDAGSNIGTGAFTVTITGTSAAPSLCRNITISGLDGAMTLAFNASTNFLDVYGNLSFPATNLTTTNSTGAPSLRFRASAGTQTITTNGVQINAFIDIIAAGATVQLLSNVTTNSQLRLTSGTLNLNNFTFSLGGTQFTSSNGNVRSIAFGTTGSITITGGTNPAIGISNATNFSYTGTFNINCTGTGSGAATRIIEIGNFSAGGFTESNAPNIGASVTNGISLGTVNTTFLAILGIYNNIDFTSVGGTSPGTFGGSITAYGNVTLSASHTLNVGSGNTFTFAKTSATQTFTTNGATLTCSNLIKTGAGTLSLTGAANFTSTFTLTQGTFESNNNNITAGAFSSSNSNVRTLNMGSGTWTLTSFGTLWNCATSTNLTLNASTSTISLTNTGTVSRSFDGGGRTYNNLSIGGATGIAVLTIAGSNTFNTISSTKTVAHTIRLTSGTTTTVTSWTVNGTSGNLVTLDSTTAGTQATLAKSGGGTVTVNWYNIRDSNASPASTWFANNTTNSGNNTNWTISGPPLANFLLFLRP